MPRSLLLDFSAGHAALFPAEAPSPLLVLFCFHGEAAAGERLLAALPAGLPPFSLLAFSSDDPDGAYSPGPLRDGERVLAGRAEELRALLREELLPRAEALAPVAARYALGYSLGGLAAMHFSLGEDALFTRCGSCSGSLWYPGWAERAAALSLPERIYLSLGGREKNTPDPLMAPVEEKTRYVYEAVRSRTRAVLRWEPGGHFRDPDGRLARGAAWLLQE